jgi:predicted transcriptional regulator
MPTPVRDRLHQMVDQLPPDATLEDAIERLVFLTKVERGLAQADAGQAISHEDVRRQLGL